MKIRFSLLSEDTGKASRQNFSCGSPELDHYLRRQAGQDATRGFATVVLACASENPPAILGYYSFSAASVPLSALPAENARKMPRYRDVPAILLGRLAVALPMQNRHVGSLLLFDALRRSCANELAWAVFLTEAKNNRAVAFYEKFGFLRFQHNPQSLWITRKYAETLVRTGQHF